MLKIDKLVIGVRIASKMFRVTSLGGQIIDAILALRGTKLIDKEYYREVSISLDRGIVNLKNKSLGNTLQIDLGSVIFVKDAYGQAQSLNFEKAHEEFSILWTAINDILNINDVRSIGILAEHQIKGGPKKVSAELIETLTTIKPQHHPAKFRLRYEERRQTPEGVAPDVAKSDFVNVIYDYYDGELDADHPTLDTFNANIDVQRYYSPLLKSRVPDETKKLYKTFVNANDNFEDILKNKGLVS